MGRRNDIGPKLSKAFLPVAEAFLKIGPVSNLKERTSSAVSSEAGQMHDELGLADSPDMRNPIQLVGLMLAARQLAVADYLRGISTVAVHGGYGNNKAGLSAAPIARAALEALAHIFWMAEPGIGARERVRRLLWDAAHDIRSRHKVVTAARAGGVEPLLEVDKIIEMCQAYDVDFKLGTPVQDTDIALPHVRGEPRPPAFQLMREMMSGIGAPQLGAIFYNLMSDVAHASTQGLLNRATVTEDDEALRVTVDRQRELRHAAPVVFAVARPAQRLVEYYGQDDQPFAKVYSAATDHLAGWP